MVERYNLEILNLNEYCEGKITWKRTTQFSTKYFAIVNERLLKDFVSRKIDEDNLIFDLYGHNAIEVYFKSEQEAKQKKMDIEYFGYKEKDLENFAAMNEERKKEGTITESG